MTGPSIKPDSSTQVVPVISPLPFNENQPPNTGWSLLAAPRGRIAVTPVRTALPSGKSLIIDSKPTVTPAISVIALNAPGVPSNGMPRSRARGSATASSGNNNSVRRAFLIGHVHVQWLGGSGNFFRSGRACAVQCHSGIPSQHVQHSSLSCNRDLPVD